MPARFFRFAPLAVMALSWLAYSQHGFKPLPKLVVQAKYVQVTTYQGYNLASPNVRLSRRPPRSRSGIGAHRNSLQNREFSPTLVRIRTLLVVSEQCVLNPSPDRPHICFDFSQ